MKRTFLTGILALAGWATAVIVRPVPPPDHPGDEAELDFLRNQGAI